MILRDWYMPLHNLKIACATAVGSAAVHFLSRASHAVGLWLGSNNCNGVQCKLSQFCEILRDFRVGLRRPCTALIYLRSCQQIVSLIKTVRVSKGFVATNYKYCCHGYQLVTCVTDGTEIIDCPCECLYPSNNSRSNWRIVMKLVICGVPLQVILTPLILICRHQWYGHSDHGNFGDTSDNQLWLMLELETHTHNAIVFFISLVFWRRFATCGGITWSNRIHPVMSSENIHNNIKQSV